MVPHLSHFYPTFGLARLLQEKGLRVVYAGPPSYREMVEEEGFELRPVQYASEFVIRRFSVAVGLFIKTLLDAAFTRNRYREFMKNVWAVENLVQVIKPDIVFVDATLGHYYPCWKEKTVVQLTTRLSPCKSPGIPPLNSLWIPKGRINDLHISNWLWFWHIKTRQAKELLKKIIFISRSDSCFYHRYFQEHGLCWSEVMQRDVCFYDALKDIPLLILTPKELEFSWRETRPHEQYLHLVAKRNQTKQHTAAYQEIRKALLKIKETEGVKLVYVSLGTLSHNNYVQAEQFLKKVALALGGLDGIEVLISTGGIEIEIATTALNLHYLAVVPQLDILPHCDLMITHGGSGTVIEWLEAGVPMVVYPLNNRIDQPGIGARVFHRQWGLRGRISDSVIQIRKKTLKALSAMYKENCQAMQRIVSQKCSNQSRGTLFQRLGILEQDSFESTISIVSL